ncbi:MAG: HAD family hydrolase, partial [Solirubrobacteraceae bacterium]
GRVSERGRLEAVVFDPDGLLLDTEESWTRAERTLFARRGLEFTAEHKLALLGTAPDRAAAMFEEIFDAPGKGPELVAELGLLVYEEMGSYAPPRPGARELIARLGEAGVPIALASNSHRILVDRALATAGIDPGVFVAILTADVVSRPKPAPDIYLAACDALGTRPADTLALEDSPTGVAAAVAAGCYTIAVPSLEGVVLDAADVVVESLADPAITRALGL